MLREVNRCFRPPFLRLLLITLLAFSLTEEIIAKEYNEQDEVKGGASILFGDLKVDETHAAELKPAIFYVTLQTNGGAVVSRQPVSSGGRYRFFDLPNGEYDIIVEMEGLEVARVHIMIAEPRKTDVRRDIELEWRAGPGGEKRTKAATVSAADVYQRTPANQTLFDKALEESSKNNYAQSIQLLNQVVDSDPKDYIALTELGTLYFKTGKLAEAEQSYRRALEQQPTFIVALVNLGKAEVVQKHYDQAIETLLRAVQAHPESADANYFLGESYLQIKKGSKAVGYLKEAIRLGMPEAHLRLAALYHAAGRKDLAAAEYEQFLAEKPNFPGRKKLEQYIKDNKKQ